MWGADSGGVQVPAGDADGLEEVHGGGEMAEFGLVGRERVVEGVIRYVAHFGSGKTFEMRTVDVHDFNGADRPGFGIQRCCTPQGQRAGSRSDVVRAAFLLSHPGLFHKSQVAAVDRAALLSGVPPHSRPAGSGRGRRGSSLRCSREGCRPAFLRRVTAFSRVFQIPSNRAVCEVYSPFLWIRGGLGPCVLEVAYGAC